MKNIILILLFLLVCCGTRCFAGKNNDIKQILLSFDTQDKTLHTVFKDITKQTGWTIVFDSNLADKIVSGSFSKVHFDSFLKTVLKGESLIVLYDEESNTVEIRSFGKKGAQQKQIVVHENESNFIPSEEEQQKISASQIEEEKAFEDYVNNPSSVEPLTGMTLGEIASIHAQEQEIFEEYVSNPSSVEPLTGMVLGDISTLDAQMPPMVDPQKPNSNLEDSLKTPVVFE